mmetsp:Transcript_5373/g.21296  ORF Transcript_5373/g.21296 Transcript_5373/m.21296 type:complete len:244 (-) Transcript_5373:278-1009(-)
MISLFIGRCLLRLFGGEVQLNVLPESSRRQFPALRLEDDGISGLALRVPQRMRSGQRGVAAQGHLHGRCEPSQVVDSFSRSFQETRFRQVVLKCHVLHPSRISIPMGEDHGRRVPTVWLVVHNEGVRLKHLFAGEILAFRRQVEPGIPAMHHGAHSVDGEASLDVQSEKIRLGDERDSSEARVAQRDCLAILSKHRRRNAFSSQVRSNDDRVDTQGTAIGMMLGHGLLRELISGSHGGADEAA